MIILLDSCHFNTLKLKCFNNNIVAASQILTPMQNYVLCYEICGVGGGTKEAENGLEMKPFRSLMQWVFNYSSSEFYSLNVLIICLSNSGTIIEVGGGLLKVKL